MAQAGPNRERNQAEWSDDDNHILRHWHEWQIDGFERRIVFCVETLLELRPSSGGFNASKLDELVNEATDLMRASASPIDSIRIIPVR